MKIHKFNSKEEWELARNNKITGTRAKELIVRRGKEQKIEFYRMLAERIGIPRDNENRMDRGLRLEDEAIKEFEKQTGKKVNNDLVIWCRDDDERIALSPDGAIGKTEAIEVKCLDQAVHLKAYITRAIPSEYKDQALQYFVVNDSLRKLYFTFYDPTLPCSFFYLELTRKELKKEIEANLKEQRNILVMLDELEDKLTF